MSDEKENINNKEITLVLSEEQKKNLLYQKDLNVVFGDLMKTVSESIEVIPPQFEKFKISIEEIIKKHGIKETPISKYDSFLEWLKATIEYSIELERDRW